MGAVRTLLERSASMGAADCTKNNALMLAIRRHEIALVGTMLFRLDPMSPILDRHAKDGQTARTLLGPIYRPA